MYRDPHSNERRYPSLDRYSLRTSSSTPSPQPGTPPAACVTRRKLTGPNYLQNILNSDSEPDVEPSSSRYPYPGRREVADRPVLPQSDYDADYLRRQLCLHPGFPVDLWAIADPPDGQKPFASLPTLVKLAIHGSPHKRLTLQGICEALIGRFTWFHEHRQDDAWKNSVRHNLSLNKVFRKIPRDVTHLGKGCYWELDLAGGEGHKRPRKRNKKYAESDHDESEYLEPADNFSQTFDEGPRASDALILRQPYSPPPEPSRQGRSWSQ
ncbi:hypothetical protein B0H16DRAFT_1599560 [Mycena metata]|uniref:Fork-head domain-containing protein n=1 Tax=Mycena metata TaxID=1033252 RepID=A0AAD7HLY7_9AGAR|nr:hypothetical protein B0H16DRAFT_1599560 [Mycena metata]